MPHIHEKIDFTATAYIVYGNKVLLHQHKKHHFWLGVGGHIELDEEPNQAIIREAREESGLDITLLDIHHSKINLRDYNDDDFETLVAPAFLNIHKINEDHRHVDMVYLAVSSGDELIPEDRTMVLKWFTEEELADKKYGLPERIVFYCKEALKWAGMRG